MTSGTMTRSRLRSQSAHQSGWMQSTPSSCSTRPAPRVRLLICVVRRFFLDRLFSVILPASTRLAAECSGVARFQVCSNFMHRPCSNVRIKQQRLQYCWRGHVYMRSLVLMQVAVCRVAKGRAAQHRGLHALRRHHLQVRLQHGAKRCLLVHGRLRLDHWPYLPHLRPAAQWCRERGV